MARAPSTAPFVRDRPFSLCSLVAGRLDLGIRSKFGSKAILLITILCETFKTLARIEQSLTRHRDPHVLAIGFHAIYLLKDL